MRDKVEGGKKAKFNYEKTIRNNEGSKTLRVEEVENGFIVEITKESHGEEYKYECKKYITSSNPMVNEVESSKDMLSEIEHLL